MKTKSAFTALAAVAALAVSPGLAAEISSPFTQEEIRALVSHGPWPVPLRNDPGNRVSGNRAAVDFGERLFFDTRISGSGKFSCGTCHIPERNWTDNRTRGTAVAEVDRNVPTLMNVRLGHQFGWDGAAGSLPAQSVRPILDRRELAATPRHVADLIRKDEQLSCSPRTRWGPATRSGRTGFRRRVRPRPVRA